MSYAELTHAELAALKESLEQGIRTPLRQRTCAQYGTRKTRLLPSSS